MATGPLLSCREVGELLSVSKTTAWRLVRSGQLRAYTVGGQIRVATVDAENYLKSIPLPAREEDED